MTRTTGMVVLMAAAAMGAFSAAWLLSPGAGLFAGSVVIAAGAAWILSLYKRLAHLRRTRRATEAKYRQLMEKSLAGIFIYRDDTILYANAKFKEILGYRPEEGLGKSFWDYIYELDLPKVRAMVERRQEGQSDLQYECRLRSSDDKPVWAEIVSSLMDYEDAPAVLVSVYDITERKETEEKRRELSHLARRQEEQLIHSTRLAEMGEMAAGVAHELNQPLTSIKNFAKNAAYMLDEQAGNLDDVRENLHMIAGQVDRAARIINQMRELARRSEQYLALVDINVALRDSVRFVMPQMRLSGVDVVLQLADALPPVLGDRIRLEQVFLNLLMNARHAMEEAPVRRLTLRTRHEPEGEWPILVEVADTGHGFSPEVAEKLFTPFFSTKKAGQGTGLGLSISLGIIKDHGGAIDAEGAGGQGATFRVRLPAAQPQAAAPEGS